MSGDGSVQLKPVDIKLFTLPVDEPKSNPKKRQRDTSDETGQAVTAQSSTTSEKPMFVKNAVKEAFKELGQSFPNDGLTIAAMNRAIMVVIGEASQNATRRSSHTQGKPRIVPSDFAAISVSSETDTSSL